MPIVPIPVIDTETHTEGFVLPETTEWGVLNKWAEAHGLDPREVLASDGLTRDVDGIRFTRILRDETGQVRIDPTGNKVLLQSATHHCRPRPFPEAIAASMQPRPDVAPTSDQEK